MPEQSSAGKTLLKTMNNERGAILVMMTIAVLVFTLLFACMVELGRYLIVREQLQTAADAASLAASTSGVHRWVKINVTTDRGQVERCNKDTCWCSPCGTMTIRNIVGDERRLIDEGGWQDFCVPPCDCGGGDCWFTLSDRWVTYDITSSVWGADPGEIIQIERDLTEAVRQALAWKAYPHNNQVQSMLAGRSLTNISSMISSWNSWWSAWKSASYHCSVACSGCYSSYCESENYDCYECRLRASSAFNKVNSYKGWVDSVMSQIIKIKHANQRGGPGYMDMVADNAANALFNANIPEQSDNAWISRINVHKQRHDPYYPSVTVYGSARIKSLFAGEAKGLFGYRVFPDNYQTDVCSQGDTFYRHPNTQQGNHYGSLYGLGKWIKAPPDACWKDLQ